MGEPGETMNQDILLHISTLVMNEENQEAENYHTQLPARLFQRNDAVYILYTEEDIPNNDTVKVRVKMKDGAVEIRRESQMAAYCLYLLSGKTFHTEYQTAFGTFEMTVRTKSVACSLEAGHLKLQMSYKLYAEAGLVGDYFIVMEAEL